MKSRRAGDVDAQTQDLARLLAAEPDTHDPTGHPVKRHNRAQPRAGKIGVSISRFRNHQRLQRFLRIYGRGRRTTALAAAHEAGFGSYAQFYRVFREQTGRSPSALRSAAADYDLTFVRDDR
jgi:AraC-like DNA-binding protein